MKLTTSPDDLLYGCDCICVVSLRICSRASPVRLSVKTLSTRRYVIRSSGYHRVLCVVNEAVHRAPLKTSAPLSSSLLSRPSALPRHVIFLSLMTRPLPPKPEHTHIHTYTNTHTHCETRARTAHAHDKSHQNTSARVNSFRLIRVVSCDECST